MQPPMASGCALSTHYRMKRASQSAQTPSSAGRDHLLIAGLGDRLGLSWFRGRLVAPRRGSFAGKRLGVRVLVDAGFDSNFRVRLLFGSAVLTDILGSHLCFAFSLLLRLRFLGNPRPLSAILFIGVCGDRGDQS